MFEALDYEFDDYHWSDTGRQATLVPQDEPMLIYTQYDDNRAVQEQIMFRKYMKCVDVSLTLYIGEAKQLHRYPAPLNYAELKAIMKQFEELGWNKEEEHHA
jgi:hypothetical protein